MNATPTQQENKNFLDGYNIKRSAHPGLIFLDLIFKGAPIALYFLAFLSSNQFVVQLSTISIIAAIDFWFTKNILGRVLVGLRWGRVISEDGHEEFIYECKRDESASHPVDKKLFWSLLSLTTIVWLVLLIINIMTISNIMIIIIPFSLSAFNLYSFYSCSQEQQTRVKQYIDTQKEKGAQRIVNDYLAPK